MENIRSWLRTQDNLVQPFYKSIHAGDSSNQRTLLGGTLSVLVKLILYYVAVDQALRMFNMNGPEVNSQEVVFASQEKIYLNTTSKTLIEIWQGAGEPVPLTVDSRKYMRGFLK